MHEVEVIALQRFSHYHMNVQPGDKLKFSPRIAKQLAKSQLVRILDGEPETIHPIPPTGAKSSASPAGQASPQTTAILSAAGEALAKVPGSNPPTPAGPKPEPPPNPPPAKRKPGRPRKTAQ